MNRLVVFAAAAILSTAGPAAQTPPQQPPTAERWREDLRYLGAELAARHPNLFHTVTREQFDASIRALDARIASLGPDEILVELARLTAPIGELHTGVSLHRQSLPLLAELHAFPVRFHLFTEGLFIQAIESAHGAVAGARVVSIGSESWEEAYRRISSLVLADNAMGRATLGPLYLSFAEALRLLGITKDADTLRLVVERSAKREELTLSAAPLPSLFALLDPNVDPAGLRGFVSARDAAARPAPLWLQEPGNRYWFRLLDHSGIAYMRIDQMLDKTEEPLSAFFRRALSAIDQAPVKRLIIDLRRNVGGNNLALPLIEGLLARPSLNQRGKIVVIIGRATVSSGQNLATLLERYTQAVFVGEPTGQRPNHYGAMARLTLPNSRISVTYSRFLLIDSDPDDVRASLRPDLHARLTPRDYASNLDPVFDAAVAYDPQPALPPLAEVLADAYLPEFAIEPLLTEYRRLRPRFLSTRNTMEAELLKLGRNLLVWGRPLHSIAVFELCVENEPDSDRAHSALAMGYAAAGQAERARQTTQRALDLNPWNRDARVASR